MVTFQQLSTTCLYQAMRSSDLVYKEQSKNDAPLKMVGFDKL